MPNDLTINRLKIRRPLMLRLSYDTSGQDQTNLETLAKSIEPYLDNRSIFMQGIDIAPGENIISVPKKMSQEAFAIQFYMNNVAVDIEYHLISDTQFKVINISNIHLVMDIFIKY